MVATGSGALASFAAVVFAVVDARAEATGVPFVHFGWSEHCFRCTSAVGFIEVLYKPEMHQGILVQALNVQLQACDLASLFRQANSAKLEMPILLRSVSKSFSRKAELGLSQGRRELRNVLRNVNLEVSKGETVCVLGKNGSGKTTLIRILSTLVVQDEGEVRVCGYDVVTQGRDVRRRVGVMLNAGETGFQARLSGPSNLEYYAALYRIRLRDARNRIQSLFADLGLEDRGSDQYQSYSSGMRRRLALARALLPDPTVLLLDEPTLGVDPWSTEQIHKQLRDLSRQGKTILCTTNSLSEAEALGTRTFTLQNGLLATSKIAEVAGS